MGIKRALSVVFLPLALLLTACGETLPPDELLARGRAALENGDYQAASIDAKAALQQLPRSTEGRKLLGDIALAKASFAEAAEEYEKALSFENDPGLAADYAMALVEAGKYRDLLDEALDGRFVGLENNAVILAALANAEGAVGNRPKAADLIESAKRNTADHPFVRLVEVRHLASIDGDVEKARQRADALVVDYPNYAAAFSTLAAVATIQQDNEAAVKAYARAAELNPLRLRDRLSLVAAHMSVGDTDAAAAEVAALDKLVPKNPILNFYQGRLALADGRIDEGLEEMDAVLADLPAHAGALYFAGLANLEQGNLATAERQLGNFLQQSPDHIEGRLALGRLYLQTSEAERAENMAKGVLKSSIGNVSAVRILAAALSLQSLHAESADLYGQLVAAAETPDAVTQAQYGTELIRSGNEAGIAELEKARDLDPTNEQARRLLVGSYLAKGEPDKARAEAEAFREAAPDSAIPLVLLGQVSLWDGDDAGAAKAFDDALAIEPTSAEALRGKAGLALRSGDTDAAEKVFADAVAQQPEDLQSLVSLAAIQERQGDKEGMAASLRKAVDSNPEALGPRIALARYLMQEGQYGEGVALLTEVRDANDESPALHELLAGGFLALGELDSAVTAAERLLTLRPDSARALTLAAVTNQADRKFDRAETLIQKALEIAPENAQARRTLVELYLLQKKYDELATLLAGYPPEILEKRDVKLARGRVELMRGNPGEAIDLLRDAHAMGGDSRSVFLLVSANLRAGNASEAEAVADAWLADNPEDAAILQQYSTYLLANGRDKRGAELLERLYKLAPDDVVVLNNLAWAYRQSDPAKALALADKALEKAPDNMSVVDTRSVVLMEKGDFEAALEANDQALKLAPGFPQLLFHRGQILAGMGRNAEAINVLEKVSGTQFAEREQAEKLLLELKAGD